MKRRFDVAPQPKLAIQLSCVLWLAVLSFVAPVAILTGQVRFIGEYISIFTGLATGILIAYGLYLAFRLLAGKPLWLAYAGIVCAIFSAAFMQTGADYGGQFLIHAIFAEHVMPQTDPISVGRTALIYWCVYVCNAALFWLSFVKGYADKEKGMRAEAQLAMLRLQLNPHFMVNSLSTISDLITNGEQEEAVIVTDKLAAFLRSSLQISGEPLITLHDELFAVESYLGIEEVRFHNRLDVSIACPEEVEEALVPNFILQPLVENVLRHSAAVSSEMLFMNITAARVGEKLQVEVRNNFPNGGLALKSKGMGIGLENCRSRLALLFGSNASLTANAHPAGFRVVLEMPLTY